ncbi:MAG TPA: DUF1643 domain-containing protein, partial [Niastella sp.]
DNDHHLSSMSAKCPCLVFAWGNGGGLHDRSKQVVEMFPKAYCMGKTNSGQPKHPLYLPKQSQLTPFV